MQFLGCKKRSKKSEKWGTTASNRPAALRERATGKTPPYLVGESPPADTGQIPCGSEKTLPLEAQIRGRFRSGEGKGINPLPRDWEGRDLFENLSTERLHALRHKASVDFVPDTLILRSLRFEIVNKNTVFT